MMTSWTAGGESATPHRKRDEMDAIRVWIDAAAHAERGRFRMLRLSAEFGKSTLFGGFCRHLLLLARLTLDSLQFVPSDNFSVATPNRQMIRKA